MSIIKSVMRRGVWSPLPARFLSGKSRFFSGFARLFAFRGPLWYIFFVPTKKRIEKVKKVLFFRQPDLRVVLEDVQNTHNASAVVRTCDGAGILHLDIISSDREPFSINEAISTRAEKWLQFHYYPSTGKCLKLLKKKGLKIAVTHLSEDALPYTALDYTMPIAIVFGNESEGTSKEALALADYKIKIPMFGMVQSLNLSVSAGIILYEAMKQRMEKGLYRKPRLSSREFEAHLKKWVGQKPGRKRSANESAHNKRRRRISPRLPGEN